MGETRSLGKWKLRLGDWLRMTAYSNTGWNTIDARCRPQSPANVIVEAPKQGSVILESSQTLNPNDNH